MQRTPQAMVDDLRAIGRTDEQIKSVARAVRGGAWVDEVYAILGGKNYTPSPAVVTTSVEEVEEDSEDEVETAAADGDEELPEPVFEDEEESEQELELEQL